MRFSWQKSVLSASPSLNLVPTQSLHCWTRCAPRWKPVAVFSKAAKGWNNEKVDPLHHSRNSHPKNCATPPEVKQLALAKLVSQWERLVFQSPFFRGHVGVRGRWLILLIFFNVETFWKVPFWKQICPYLFSLNVEKPCWFVSVTKHRDLLPTPSRASSRSKLLEGWTQGLDVVDTLCYFISILKRFVQDISFLAISWVFKIG